MSKKATVDLEAMARDAMIKEGFQPSFGADVMKQVTDIAALKGNIKAAEGTKDLRSLLWSSIDNVSSRDLDQVEYVEKLPSGNIKLLVGIADVDAYVEAKSPVDKQAQLNSTSVYTGIVTFPMLPVLLSEDATSLKQGEDRLAIVAEMEVDPQGTLVRSDVYQAILQNKAKLDYESIGNWLEGTAPAPPIVQSTPGLTEQLKLQSEQSDHFRALRAQRGSLNLDTIEASAVTQNGQVIDLQIDHKNQAKDLIESFMVAANGVFATFLENNNKLSIRRIVRQPKRWPRIVELAKALGTKLPAEPDSKALAQFLVQQRTKDPDHFPDLSLSIVKLLGSGEYTVVVPGEAHEGHFALAVHDYTHSTAPNRRFADLATHRLIKACMNNQPGYSKDELTEIAEHCTEREEAAKKVERFMRKIAAADLLSKHIGDTYDAIITGINQDGTYIRLLRPPAEGKLVQGAQGVDVGDRIKARLISVDAVQGFIDFAKA